MLLHEFLAGKGHPRLLGDVNVHRRGLLELLGLLDSLLLFARAWSTDVTLEEPECVLATSRLRRALPMMLNLDVEQRLAEKLYELAPLYVSREAW